MIVGFVPLDELPLAVLHLHDLCNQRCPYCVAETSSRRGFGRIAEAAARQAIVRFFADHGPYQIMLNGGEPLITPNLFDMLEALAAQGHLITLQSNLKAGVERFMRAVRPEQTGYIMTAFHSVVLHRLSPYLGVVSELKARGYPVVVKLVLDDAMLAALPRVHGAFTENAVGVFLTPRIHFPQDGRVYPQAYNAAQWREIAPRMTMAASWLFFAGGWRSRGRICGAGQVLFYAWAGSGRISGCAHNFPRDLGDLYANKLDPPREMPKCGLDQCICDFHTYVGVTPGLDDSARFRALLAGPCKPVSFGDYLAFVEQAGIAPFVDLVPVIAEAGLWDAEAAPALHTFSQ